MNKHIEDWGNRTRRPANEATKKVYKKLYHMLWRAFDLDVPNTRLESMLCMELDAMERDDVFLKQDDDTVADGHSYMCAGLFEAFIKDWDALPEDDDPMDSCRSYADMEAMCGLPIFALKQIPAFYAWHENITQEVYETFLNVNFTKDTRVEEVSNQTRADYWNTWIKPYADEARAHQDPYQDQGHYDGQ